MRQPRDGQPEAPPGTEHEEPATHPRWRRMGLRLMGVCIGVAAALAIGEVAVRLLDIQPAYNVVSRLNYRFSENSILQYELKPGSADGDTVINRDGFRDRAYTTGKPAGTFRIVVIGDSITFGLLCPQDTAYPKVLERRLSALTEKGGPSYEVLNLGVTGYNTTQIVENLRVHGLKYEPDLVVYGYCLNDPQAFSLELESLRALREKAKSQHLELLSQGLHRWLAHSRLWRLMVERLMPPPTSFRKRLVDPALKALADGRPFEYARTIHNDTDAWRRVSTGLKDLAALTDAPRKVPVVVAVFPFLTELADGPYPGADVHAKIIAEAKRHGLLAIDLAPAYAEAAARLRCRLDKEMLHPNERGHEVAGNAVFDWLCASGLLPGRPAKPQP